MTSFGVRAQSFSVGNACCNYNLVNKTFTATNCVTGFNQVIKEDSFIVDIDGDLLADITLASRCDGQGGGSGHSYNDIKALTRNNTEVVCISGNCWISNLIYGTPLVNAMNWSVTPSYTPTSGTTVYPGPYLYNYFSVFTSLNWSCGSQVTSFYIGFRKILSGDTIYGWVQLDSNFPGKVIDYAYEHTAFSAGVKSNDYKNNILRVFPNPCSDHFEVKGNKEELIYLIDGLGRTLRTWQLKSESNFSVKVYDLDAGVYYVQNEHLRQKIVVIK